MLKKNNFTLENIRRLKIETGHDPSLLERAVYAFGLLEALSRAGLDFVFKGGTCLMLLLDEPKRLSTDIDIIVKPCTDIDLFIEKAAEIFPFVGCEEQIRRTARKIEKKHFKFLYRSPVRNEDLYIILDVVFEENNYSSTLKKEIVNSLLDTEPPATYITVPTVNCILGDKLTAFAPHTIGIPFGIGKEMEIIKQLYDIATLADKVDNFSEVKDTYKRFAEKEIEYRGLENMSFQDALVDSFNAALTMIGKGKLFPNDHEYLSDGVRRIKGHIFDGYSPVIAEKQSCRVAYLIANILADREEFMRITDTAPYADRSIINPDYKKLNYVKKADLTDFAYLYEATRLFETKVSNNTEGRQ
ncbi:MAG: nucleotidyl transferase AbiEii/AbiGii toxin family protein [Methanomassiliicoccaceae archaeon]|nr:nucleotidyl transferase AbiEii/AbiGii toxin family protein [Methanomassiliicoccaceae archaeon]